MLIYFLITLQYIFLVGFVAILGYLAFVMLSFKNIVPYVPSPRKAIKKMIEVAQIKNGDEVADLGSGTGKIIIAAAKKHKANLFIGIEKSIFLRTITKIKLFFHPVLKKRIQIIKSDFFNFNLNEFEVIFCFLTPEALRILTPRFKALRSGTKIISYMFHLDNNEGFDEEIIHLTAKDSIYIYTKV
jgi:phospholipid N-methyltransferase